MKKIFKIKNLSKFIFVVLFVLAVIFPASASAQFVLSCNSALVGLDFIICKIGSLLSSIIPVLVALGLVYFVWGVVQYVIGDGEEAKKKGRDTMIFGIIGFAVIIGVWGLAFILVDTFSVEESSPGGQYFQDLSPIGVDSE